MAGELLALLRVSRLKDTLRATIVTKKYMELKQFESLNCLLLQNTFWDLLFALSRAVYSGMRILRLADLKTAGMDKLLHYVYQADRVMKKYLEEAQALAKILLNDDLLGALYDNDDKKFGKDLDDIGEGEEEDEIQDYPGDFVDNSDAEDDDEVIADDDNISLLYIDGLTDKVMAIWNHRRKNLIHDYSLLGYLLCPIEAVQSQCREGITADMNEVSICGLVLIVMASILTTFLFILLSFTGTRAADK